MTPFWKEWYMRGPAVWALTGISSILIVALLIVNLRKLGLKRANIYGILIPVMAIFSVAVIHGDFISIYIR